MKILVPVKRVMDQNVRPRMRMDGLGVDLNQAKMSMNPFDEVALEEGIRLREASIASEVIAVSCGVKQCQEVLRTAMAMGADRGILIETNAELQPLAVAKLIKVIVKKESVDLVMLGKQAVDDDANQTGQMLAALLNWPQATCASRILIDNKRVQVTCEIEDAVQTIALNLPAVVTADLSLNEPRYVTLSNIIKAKKKPLDTLTPDSINVDVTPRLKTVNVRIPTIRSSCVMVSDVATLALKITKEVKKFRGDG